VGSTPTPGTNIYQLIQGRFEISTTALIGSEICNGRPLALFRRPNTMPRSRPGSGSVFQRTYRDPHGKFHKTKNWYIEFVSGNRTVREATPFLKRSDAAEFLKQRHSDSLAGKIPLAKGVTYDDLAELIVPPLIWFLVVGVVLIRQSRSMN
jgi:hypothetical protein